MTPDAPQLRNQDLRILLWFFGGPSLMLLVNIFLFPYPQPSYRWVTAVPLFGGLLLLGAGALYRQMPRASHLKMVGWVLFAIFWSTYPSLLYFSEGGDIVNAVICVVGVYVLVYLAYHEWLSAKRMESPSSLNWIAGATCLAGSLYFALEMLLPALRDGLIIVVADQTVWLMHLLGINAVQSGTTITYQSFPIHIIFACTAVQSLLLFVGMLGAMPRIEPRRRAVALLATVLPIYVLNLFRNAGVVLLSGGGYVSFEMAHNIIAKAGSLLALVGLLFLTFWIVPELYDEIMNVLSLPKRNGPLEQFFGGKR
jgi:archaeosortase A (PGF-CTERM-specific)